jgi:hypothetical protein
LRPVRACRTLTENTPKPRNSPGKRCDDLFQHGIDDSRDIALVEVKFPAGNTLHQF